MTNLVAEVSPEVMDGENDLEKAMNAYLTRRFILTKDVPSDECLSEARTVIMMVQAFDKKNLDDLRAYLAETDPRSLETYDIQRRAGLR